MNGIFIVLLIYYSNYNNYVNQIIAKKLYHKSQITKYKKTRKSIKIDKKTLLLLRLPSDLFV